MRLSTLIGFATAPPYTPECRSRIGPFASADRVWSDHMWPLYILLLLAVELHGGIGLYRLAVKWGWFAGPSAEITRARLKRVKWALTAFFLALGLATLAVVIIRLRETS